VIQSESHKVDQAAARGRLYENIVSLYILQGLNYLIPIAVLPYLIRVLGIDTYGLVAFSQAFAQYFVVLTDYGFNLSATRYIAQYRAERDKIKSMFWQVMVLKLILMLVGMAILLGIVTTVPRFRHDIWFFLVAYLAVIGNVAFPQWYFQGMEKMRYISLFSGVANIASGLLIFVFVHTRADGLVALLIQTGGTLIAGATALCVAMRQIGFDFEVPSLTSLRSTLKDGWHLFVSSAAVSLYTNTNLVLVGLLAGNVQAGYFSAADKLIRAMATLIVPFSQAIFPHISSLATRSREAALALVSRTLRHVAAVSLFSSIAVLVLAQPIAKLLFGPAASGSIPVIRWIALLPFLLAVSNILGIQTMLTFGLDRQFSRILLGSGLLNLVLGIPLIHFFGAQGAGASVLTTEVVVTITMLLSLQMHKINVLVPASIER